MRRAPLPLALSAHLLWLAAVLDPIGYFFGLRYIALFYAAACIAVHVSLNGLPDSIHSIRIHLIMFMSIITPLYGLVIYSFNIRASEFTDTSYIASGILMITSLIYTDKSMCDVGIRALVFSLRLLTLIILTIFIYQFLGSNADWIGIFTESNSAIVSGREYAGVVLPYIYFLASPMLIYLIAYEVHKLNSSFRCYRVVFCLASIVALALSGTRAHIILAIAYIPIFYALVYSTNKFIVSLGIGTGFVLILLVGGTDLFGEFFSLDETSNSMKVGMLANYNEIFDHPLSLLFGQGYNASEWSRPFREMIDVDDKASKTELTYLELIRVYGLVFAIPFFILFFIILRKSAQLPNEYRWLYPAFVVYMIDSALNPYLFSSNGMLPLGLIVSIITLARCKRAVIV